MVVVGVLVLDLTLLDVRVGPEVMTDPAFLVTRYVNALYHLVMIAVGLLSCLW